MPYKDVFCVIFLKGKPSCSKEISEGDKHSLAEDCHEESSEGEITSISKKVFPNQSKLKTEGIVSLTLRKSDPKLTQRLLLWPV